MKFTNICGCTKKLVSFDRILLCKIAVLHVV
ncbi:hypothetical protein M3J09_006759 [Ascochyta lentis]